MKRFISLIAIAIFMVSILNVKAQDKQIVEIVMVGDDLIHSPLYKAAYNSKTDIYNFDNQFKNLKLDRSENTINIINQETILVNDRSRISSYPCFGSPTEVADAIMDAGFNVVTHATNHTYDKGYSGIEDTINYWSNYPSITVLGIHNNDTEKDYKIMERNGIKIGLVNYTYGLNGISRTKDYSVDLLTDYDIDTTMSECTSQSDVVIAILHVGEEYRYTPTEYQKEQVNRFIDLGADIVICTHPHVVEPYDKVITPNGNSGIVFYSLGNFISNQTEIDRCLGGMSKVLIQKEGNKVDIKDFSMIPLFTHQQSGYYTTYKLCDYTDDMFKKHKLYGKGGINSVEDIKELYLKIVNN